MCVQEQLGSSTFNSLRNLISIMNVLIYSPTTGKYGFPFSVLGFSLVFGFVLFFRTALSNILEKVEFHILRWQGGLG